MTKINLYVISLKRSPESLTLFYANNKSIMPYVNIIPIKAVDGTEFVKKYDISHLQRTDGRLGCFLSHQNIWRIIANSKYKDISFVAEDDAIISIKVFRDLPKILNSIDKYDGPTQGPIITQGPTLDVISSVKYTVSKAPSLSPSISATYFPLYKPIIIILSRNYSKNLNKVIETISSYQDSIVIELITSEFFSTHFYMLNGEGAKVLLDNEFDPYGAIPIDIIMCDSKNLYGLLLNKDIKGYSNLEPRTSSTG